MKAVFKLKKLISGEKLLPKDAMLMYRKLIVPIGLYGAEIWGSLSNCKHMAKSFERLPFETVTMSFSKFVLGVRKQTTNAAVRGELGLVPLYTDVLIAMISYYKRIQNEPQESLLQNALRESVSLSELGSKSWYRNLINMCSEFTPINIDILKWESKLSLRGLLKTFYENEWRKLVNPECTTGKLQLYGKMKNNISYEHYLDEYKDPSA